MNRDWIDTVFRYIVILLLHVFIFGRIYLGAYINIEIYVLFILLLPSRFSSLAVLILSAIMGFSTDLLSSGDLGLHMAACTLTGYLRTKILRRIAASSSDAQITVPVIGKSPIRVFLFYVLTLLFIHNFVLYSIEAFSVGEIVFILLRSAASTLMTGLFIVLFEIMMKK